MKRVGARSLGNQDILFDFKSDQNSVYSVFSWASPLWSTVVEKYNLKNIRERMCTIQVNHILAFLWTLSMDCLYFLLSAQELMSPLSSLCDTLFLFPQLCSVAPFLLWAAGSGSMTCRLSQEKISIDMVARPGGADNELWVVQGTVGHETRAWVRVRGWFLVVWREQGGLYVAAENLPLTTTAIFLKSISPLASTRASQRYSPSSDLPTRRIWRLLLGNTWNLSSGWVKRRWEGEREKEREGDEWEGEEDQCQAQHQTTVLTKLWYTRNSAFW